MFRCRSVRRFGAWAAVFALALQIVLGFGHLHLLGAAPGTPAASIVVGGPLASDDGAPRKNTGGVAHDVCAICVTIHLAGTLVLPSSAALSAPAQNPVLIPGGAHDFALPPLPHRAFQTRAPPVA